ncbi:MAG: class I SAM-dependent methyltransferase [Ornithinimicrobium sp.]|uniref:class I SAM-dependent methyltransferase n=1 Tax=Ornithinimicrobium sp. TaxID=1977084 RepID=UPI003D9B0219
MTTPPTSPEPCSVDPAGRGFGLIHEVQIEHAAAFAANRTNWDDRAKVHAASQTYDLEGLIADPHRVSDVVAHDLPVLTAYLPGGSLDGLDLVHLQCHIGTDTLSMARQGARVTGVDNSTASLDVARELAGRAGADIRYVECDVTEAATAVEEQVDVVYTSIGTICWVRDLTAWARTIAGLLRPGGVFYFRDSHPMLATLDDLDPTDVRVLHRYFGGDVTLHIDNEGTCTDGDPSLIEHTHSYEWHYAMSETVQSLLDAGLRLRLMAEGRTLDWQALAQMVPEGADWVLPAPWADRVPLSYTLIATKD